MITAMLFILLFGTLIYAMFRTIKGPSTRVNPRKKLSDYLDEDIKSQKSSIKSSYLTNSEVEKKLPVNYDMVETLIKYSENKKEVSKQSRLLNLEDESAKKVDTQEILPAKESAPKPEKTADKFEPDLQVVVDDLVADVDVDGEMDSMDIGMPKFR